MYFLEIDTPRESTATHRRSDGSYCFLVGHRHPDGVAGRGQILSYPTVEALESALGYEPVGEVLPQDYVNDVDEHIKQAKKIWRYFFYYQPTERELVHSFCASVRDRWASSVRSGELPAEWSERQSDEGAYLLSFDATMGEAVQYGRAESLAMKLSDFDSVRFAKTLAPNIVWRGLTVTDPRDGSKVELEPSDLHLTNDTLLLGRVGTRTTEADLISHWSLTFS